MQLVLLPNVSNVDNTDGGKILVTDAQMQAATGATCIIVNPSLDIVIVDGNTGVNSALLSPVICPAGQPTVISQTSGPLRANAVGASPATVKVAIGCEP